MLNSVEKVTFMNWNAQDIEQMHRCGQTPKAVEQQIKNFKHGFSFVHLVKAATIENHGIQHFSKEKTERLAKFFDDKALQLKVTLFVPASGAASRMFKSFFAFLNDKKEGQGNDVQEFFENIEKFAFYEDLVKSFEKDGKNINDASYKERVEYLLQSKGLNYGNLPKGLLRFHHYSHGNRLAMEEHLVEGAYYGKSQQNNVYVHFTVSPEHQYDFEKTLKKVIKKYETEFGLHFNVNFSRQSSKTDTIAVNPDDTPFRNADGSLLFRPGGHGALIENLNDLDADIVFIKNIDNVVPDRLKPEIILYKKALGGFLVYIAKQIEKLLVNLKNNAEESIEKAVFFIENELYLKISEDFNTLSGKEKTLFLHQFLNRPIRVCGMVKNKGESGGCPFFVKDTEGNISLQIVETSQIDMKDKRQIVISKNATHFNPVDLACWIKDYEGNPFDLRCFVNPATGFISEKSKDGKPLKAQELPGLWNGSMAKWITLFVEVPLTTFNPVKIVNDLLREEHRI